MKEIFLTYHSKRRGIACHPGPCKEAPVLVRRQKGVMGKHKPQAFCIFHGKDKAGQGKLFGIG